MPSLKAVTASNSTYSRSYVPTAVFVGGTKGVGKAMVEQFGTMTKGRANVVVVGHKGEAGEAVLASLPWQPIPVIRKFIPCDLTLMSNVRVLNAALRDLLPDLNYLVLTTDQITSRRRTKTSEGLETHLALDYYSRWLIIKDLLPLLNQSRKNGQDAKVVSCLGGLDWVKLSKNLDPKFGQFTPKDVERAAVHYNDLMINSFGTLCPTLAFTRAYSGLRWFDEHPKILQMLPQKFPTANAQQRAQYTWWAFLDGEKGVFRRDEKGRNLGWDLDYLKYREELWNHTITKLVDHTATEVMEVTEETLRFPPLPTQMVRLIFELADRPTMHSMSLVSRDARQWLLPTLFLCVRLKQTWPQVTLEELQPILTLVKPFVQMIMVPCEAIEIVSAFLKNCPSIIHVTDYCFSDRDDYHGHPHLDPYNAFPLRSLSIAFGPWARFPHPYHSLTHLQVRDQAHIWTTWSWAFIESLTSLTHITFSWIPKLFKTSHLLLPLEEILRCGKSLRVCAVVDGSESADIRHQELQRAGLRDLRLIFISRYGVLEWEAHVRGQRCFWDKAEEMVARNHTSHIANGEVAPPSALVSRYTHRSDFDWSCFDYEEKGVSA